MFDRMATSLLGRNCIIPWRRVSVPPVLSILPSQTDVSELAFAYQCQLWHLHDQHMDQMSGNPYLQKCSLICSDMLLIFMLLTLYIGTNFCWRLEQHYFNTKNCCQNHYVYHPCAIDRPTISSHQHFSSICLTRCPFCLYIDHFYRKILQANHFGWQSSQ